MAVGLIYLARAEPLRKDGPMTKNKGEQGSLKEAVPADPEDSRWDKINL